MNDLAVVRERRAFDDFVGEIEVQRAVLDQELQEREDVARVELARVIGHRRGKIVVPAVVHEIDSPVDCLMDELGSVGLRHRRLRQV